MKLSEAIRLGSMLGPQAFGDLEQTRTRRKYFFGLIGPKVVEKSTCALGAAYAATGGPHRVTRVSDGTVAVVVFRGGIMTIPAGSIYSVIVADWDAMADRPAPCPSCGRRLLLMQTVAHLNDDHRWPRERIADFVEQIENAQSIAPAVESVGVTA